MTEVVVVGAGVAGLVAAIELAAQGLGVTVLERGASAGGKLRSVEVAGQQLDAGPTVLTLKAVFEEVFAAAGAALDDHLVLEPLVTLARHAWDGDRHFDLFADIDASADSIGVMAGAAEAQRYRRFCADARAIFQLLDNAFLRDARPTPLRLARRVGLGRLGALWGIHPFTSLWQELAKYFHHPRLRQLFARYATYVGCSPFAAPATLMLIAHVEQAGVWQIQGGMAALATALEALAGRLGVTFRYRCEVAAIDTENARVCGVSLAGGERVPAASVVANTDIAALSAGLLGRAAQRGVGGVAPRPRSLSAITWSMVAKARGFPLQHHSVFFGGDYLREFDELFQQRSVPHDPTVYVCALDRHESAGPPRASERLLCLVNAPAWDGTPQYDAGDLNDFTARMRRRLSHCGLELEYAADACVITSPAQFAALYPATGGALYGQAGHGWRASFSRAGSRTRLAGLYLAGGSVHPGPGLPMAALSGRLAAAALLADRGRGRPS